MSCCVKYNRLEWCSLLYNCEMCDAVYHNIDEDDVVKNKIA